MDIGHDGFELGMPCSNVQHCMLVFGREADFTHADADIASRHIDLRSDVEISLVHERLRERHDLGLGPNLRLKVRVTVARNDRKAVERVLEDLPETEKLDCTRINGGGNARQPCRRPPVPSVTRFGSPSWYGSPSDHPSTAHEI